MKISLCIRKFFDFFQSYKIQQGGLVAFDTVTTGLFSKNDDILQITIVGQDGVMLLNTYVKPQTCTYWDKAEAVHGIIPADVAHMKL